MNTFGEKIKKYRQDNNLTQADLANKLHVSRQAISKWETGSSYPNYDILKDIAEMLNTTVTVKRKNNRNVLHLLILSIASTLAIIIGIVAIVIAANKKDDAEVVIEDNKFIGIVIGKENFIPSELKYEVTRPTLADLSKGSYAGIYSPFDWCGLSAIRSDQLFVSGSNDETTFRTTFNINGTLGDMLNIVRIYQDKETEELIYEDDRFNGVTGVNFEVLNNNKKYVFELKFTYNKNSKSTTIKEYNDEFKLIKETEVDYNNLNDYDSTGLGIKIVDKYFEYKPTNECLYVVIEDQFEEKLDKRVVWREEMNTSKMLYYSDDYILGNFIRFKID